MTKCSPLLFSILFLTWNSSFANSLPIYFKGVLVPVGCKLSDNDMQKKVYLSGLRFSSLEMSGNSDIQSFQLDIVGCSAASVNKTIKITLHSQNIEIHNGISYLKTTGESNVLLALTNSGGKELSFNEPIDISTVTESGNGSINTLSLGVYAQKPFNARLKTGGFSSIVTFNLDYQ